MGALTQANRVSGWDAKWVKRPKSTSSSRVHAGVAGGAVYLALCSPYAREVRVVVVRGQVKSAYRAGGLLGLSRQGACGFFFVEHSPDPG